MKTLLSYSKIQLIGCLLILALFIMQGCGDEGDSLVMQDDLETKVNPSNDPIEQLDRTILPKEKFKPIPRDAIKERLAISDEFKTAAYQYEKTFVAPDASRTECEIQVPRDYETLQEAFDAASEGCTIRVMEDLPPQGPLFIYKSNIALIGPRGNKTIEADYLIAQKDDGIIENIKIENLNFQTAYGLNFYDAQYILINNSFVYSEYREAMTFRRVNFSEMQSSAFEGYYGVVLLEENNKVNIRDSKISATDGTTFGLATCFAIRSSFITVENCGFNGKNSIYNGVIIDDTNNSSVINSIAENIPNQGFMDAGEDNTYTHCKAMNCGQGFTTRASKNTLITNCSLTNCYYGFTVRLGFLPSGERVPSEDVIIQNCEAKEVESAAVLLEKSVNTLIDNCTFTNNYIGIRDYLGTVGTIIRNVICTNSSYIAMGFTDSNSPTFQNCTIKDNYYGIATSFCTSPTIENCIAENNETRGFGLRECTNVVIKGCKTYLNSNVGIAMGYCDDVFIENSASVSNEPCDLDLLECTNIEVINSEIESECEPS